MRPGYGCIPWAEYPDANCRVEKQAGGTLFAADYASGRGQGTHDMAAFSLIHG
jgi:hypothetical protein